MGHKTSLKLDSNYYTPSEQQVLQQYVKAIDFLTINDEKRLQRKVVELTEKQSDIELMKLEQKKKDKRLEDLEKSLQAQLQTQQNQQKILETIWNNMASLLLLILREMRRRRIINTTTTMITRSMYRSLA